MNKKLMALSLVIGLGLSQIPMQADGVRSFVRSHATTLHSLVKEHPLYTLLAAGSLLGASYLAYKNTKIDDASLKSEIERNVKDFLTCKLFRKQLNLRFGNGYICFSKEGQDLDITFMAGRKTFTLPERIGYEATQKEVSAFTQPIIEFIYSRNRWYHKVFHYFGAYNNQ